ncbi:MAG TPA: nuclear transport factor 2 family protein [Caulobacteraceae bacterium]|jgi:ketosteroid isomerase-like protein|nr:nuclear transport factor 2 family protein [Caulobacteraceae bacterium]
MTPDILTTIDRFWEARMAGDKAAVRSFVADNATYEMVGARAFADGALVGPAPFGPAADQLVEHFRLQNFRRLQSIVDGQKAAIAGRIDVSYRGGPAVTSEFCDLWEFDSSGKIKSLRQFVDTAMVDRMMSARD